jgi:hypothetical protein
VLEGSIIGIWGIGSVAIRILGVVVMRKNGKVLNHWALQFALGRLHVLALLRT